MGDEIAKKVVGILGGMGPEATADLFLRIIKATPAKKDQDHLRIIVDDNPRIPDRTEAILGVGPNPLPEMIRTAQNLERAGADFIVMPCNTAHYFLEELQKNVGIPILNMIELTAEEIKRRLPNARRVGLLATTGAVKTGIYERALAKVGVEVLVPEGELQDRVMEAIYGNIKAGNLEGGREIILEMAKHLVERGAEAIICGCTEVSLVLKQGDLPVPVVDPLQILAEQAVRYALGGA